MRRMDLGAPAGDESSTYQEASERPVPASPRGRRWWPVALGGVLCIAGLISVYATASLDDSPVSSPQPRSNVALVTPFHEERGFDGLTWQWMPTRAGLTLTGSGRYWIGFRAHSLRQPRSLVFHSQN